MFLSVFDKYLYTKTAIDILQLKIPCIQLGFTQL